jgi:sulfide:quinone oxidoreductase
LRVKSAPAEGVIYAIGDVTVMPLPGRYKPEVGLSLPKAGVFAEAQGKVAAHQIAAAILGQPATKTFDGHGYCYLEVGGGRAMRADGDFFAVPHPAVTRPSSDEAQWRHKLDWVAAHLQPNH